jgi:hypothetical protein
MEFVNTEETGPKIMKRKGKAIPVAARGGP